MRRSSRLAAREVERLDALSVFPGLADPENYKEAMKRADADEWKRAMQDEINSLHENQTWTLTTLPENRQAVDCKWVYRMKRNADDGCIRYKARLVARGFSQREGIDFTETYSPVVKQTSIRFLLAISTRYNLRIRQLDAVTAFLNGDLSEEIYMLQPKGYNDGTGRVCKLLKSLYGLKQSSRVWNEKLNTVLLSTGLQRSSMDRCVYYMINEKQILILIVYVDDFLIFSNDKQQEQQIVDTLMGNFKMKDLGPVSSVLGVRITRDEKKNSITIDQEGYILKILQKFGMSDCHPASSPLDANQKLSLDDGPTEEAEKEKMKKVPYREIIGSLMYAALWTRPDICFAVSYLSRFSNNPGKAHWSAAKRVLRYLRGTIEHKLVYRNDDKDVYGYSDADWGGDLDERKSTSGYAFLFQGSAISWCSQAQKTVAIASAHSELASAVKAIQEAIWLKEFEAEMFESVTKKMVLFVDNQSAIHMARHGGSSSSKHVHIKEKFVQENIDNGNIVLKYIPTDQQTADILTKPMTPAKQAKFTKLLGLQ